MTTARPSREQWFLELAAENQARIHKICRVYAWSPEDQDDLRQEILVQIWRGLPQLEHSTHANTWLYRVALNTAISFLRRRNTRQDRTSPYAPAELQHLADSAQDILAVEDPQLTALYEAISKLDAIERAVITLFLEDLSYDQIAEVTGLSKSNVGVLLHRAKKRLADLTKEALHE